MVAEAGDGDFCGARVSILFEGAEESTWAPSPNGEFAVTLEPPEASRLILVQNFDEVLRERLGN